MANRVAVQILGVGKTRLGKFGKPASSLMRMALESALGDAGVSLRELDGLIAIPSLSDPHFMEAHYLATQMGLLPHPRVTVRTLDTGGAGPVSGLIEATRLIQMDRARVVAVVAGDAVSSLSSEEFLKRADQGCRDPLGELQSPVIPRGYDRIAQWQMQTYGVTREQLAMCSVLMSHQASRHPDALTRRPHTLAEVLGAPKVGEVTNLLECARRADGGAAIVVASQSFASARGLGRGKQPVFVRGGGEGSGPLYPPPVLDEDVFSCEDAARKAYEEAGMSVSDIGFFGLYDCFPICLIRAIEAVGLAPHGAGGQFVEQLYRRLVENADTAPRDGPLMNINTHGGLLGFGAPWETPAMYNIIEAVEQLLKRAHGRQLPDPKSALVYGNGGIFSQSAVAVLSLLEGHRTTQV